MQTERLPGQAHLSNVTHYFGHQMEGTMFSLRTGYFCEIIFSEDGTSSSVTCNRVIMRNIDFLFYLHVTYC